MDESLQEVHAKEQEEKAVKHEEERLIKKQKTGAIDYSHPLMTSEMNLLEISHRTVEIVEKYKLNVVGQSDGDVEEDIAKFKDFLFDTLVKFK